MNMSAESLPCYCMTQKKKKKIPKSNEIWYCNIDATADQVSK